MAAGYGYDTISYPDAVQLQSEVSIVSPGPGLNQPTQKVKKPKTQEELNKQFLKEQKIALFKIKKHPLVEKCTIDGDGNVTVRTKEVLAKGYPMGAYEIFIDFINRRVKMLNTTRRATSDGGNIFDGPCINNTDVCWGNLESDIQDDLRNRKLYMIVDECIDFLQNGHVGKPYMTPASFFRRARKTLRVNGFKDYYKNSSVGEVSLSSMGLHTIESQYAQMIAQQRARREIYTSTSSTVNMSSMDRFNRWVYSGLSRIRATLYSIFF